MKNKVNDLRNALVLLKELPGQLVTTDVEVDPMAQRAEELGQRLPISISIGVDPAIEIGSCFEPPTTPLGYDELSVAGALRGEPVQPCPAVCKMFTALPPAAASIWPSFSLRKPFPAMKAASARLPCWHFPHSAN